MYIFKFQYLFSDDERRSPAMNGGRPPFKSNDRGFPGHSELYDISDLLDSSYDEDKAIWQTKL